MTNLSFGKGVAERDIDLLMIEEFYSSEGFRNWFIETAGIEALKGLTFTEAKHSFNYSNGESDLVIVFRDSAGKEHWLLIEDKITAQFQPDQEKRYAERVIAYVQSTKGDHANIVAAYAVLVAPKKYHWNKQEIGFVTKVSYESILDWYKSQNTGIVDEARKNYKIKLLETAINQKIYFFFEIEQVVNFWYSYVNLLNELAPQLRPENISPSGRDSFWKFSHPNLEGLKSVKLLHKLNVVQYNGGFVELQFSGMAAQLGKLHELFDAVREKGMEIEERGKSASVSIKVPKIDLEGDFEEQKAALIIGITKLGELADWFSKYRSIWDKYQREIAK